MTACRQSPHCFSSKEENAAEMFLSVVWDKDQLFAFGFIADIAGSALILNVQPPNQHFDCTRAEYRHKTSNLRLEVESCVFSTVSLWST